VVRPDRRSFRVRLQEGYSLRGDLSIPEGAKASPTRIVALWQDKDRPGWSEASIPSGQGGFTIDGVPRYSAIALLAWNESGLSAGHVQVEAIGSPPRDEIVSVRLQPTARLLGRLSQGQRPSELLATWRDSSDVPEFARSLPRFVKVNLDGGFVI